MKKQLYSIYFHIVFLTITSSVLLLKTAIETNNYPIVGVVIGFYILRLITIQVEIEQLVKEQDETKL